MITVELVNYIRGQISHGQNLETIKATLLSQKWNEADINEVFSQIRTSQSVQSPQSKIQTEILPMTDKKIKTKSLVVILLLIILYPIGLICMYFLTKWKWWVKLLITLPLILIFAFLILSINPQEAIEKAEKLKTKCANICSKDSNYETCYSQCVSNRKQIE